MEYTDQFGDWFETLDERSETLVVAAVKFLQEQGPMLGRPFVDTVKSSVTPT